MIMEELKYFEIIKALSQMKEQDQPPVLKIKILSNIVVHQLPSILDYHLRSNGIPCSITVGNYDNIIQDASNTAKDEVVVLFWEAANVMDGFHYLANTMKSKEIGEYLQKVKREVSLVFNELKSQKKVLMNTFHPAPFDHSITVSAYELFTKELNTWLYANLPANFVPVDLTNIFMRHGVGKLFDLRNFYSSKALYSVDFFKSYSLQVAPMIKALTGWLKKVLVVDCDNTLWKGIVGEDGREGIKINHPYRSIQSVILELCSKGILICLCSKNNPGDVDDVLHNHPDMLIRDEHIIIKKVNWEDKAANIRSLARELNLGLSSFVFLDDSSFEVNLVKQQVPEVETLQVPHKTNEYTSFLAKLTDLFFRFESSTEDSSKTQQYREQINREHSKTSFSSIEDYLRSLEIHLTIEKNKEDLLPRVAQMTQKTNQFNLTTKRYTEQDIANMLDNRDIDIFTLSVRDKFGDSGVTGLAILKTNDEYEEIDTLLMSCRVLGRNIEWVFMNELISNVEKPLLKSQYIPTSKNMQVIEFYEQLGFRLVKSRDGVKEYELDKSTYRGTKVIDYITVN